MLFISSAKLFRYPDIHIFVFFPHFPHIPSRLKRINTIGIIYDVTNCLHKLADAFWNNSKNFLLHHQTWSGNTQLKEFY